MNTYGRDKVAQIITFQTYGIRSIFKEAVKYAGMTAEEADEIAKVLPQSMSYDEIEDIYKNPDKERETPERDIKQAIEAYIKLEEVFVKYPKVADAVKHLRGLIKGTSVHAGGVLISKVVLDGNVPLEYSTGSAVLPVIQIAMNDIPFYSLLNV